MKPLFLNGASVRRGGAATHFNLLRDEWARVGERELRHLLPSDTEAVAIAGAVDHRHSLSAADPRLRTTLDQSTVRRLSRDSRLISLVNHGPIGFSGTHVVLQRNAIYFDPEHQRSRRESLLRMLAVATCRTATAVVVPSSAMANWLEPLLPSSVKLVARAHPVDIQRLAGAWERPDEPVRVLVPSSPQPHKGLEHLEFLAGSLRRFVPQAEVHVTAPLPTSVPGLRSVSRYERRDLPSIASRYHALYVPSSTESFSYPMVEAQLLGIPVVASDIPAHREYCHTATLVNSLDTRQAAEALAGALERRENTQANSSFVNSFDPTAYASFLAGLTT